MITEFGKTLKECLAQGKHQLSMNYTQAHACTHTDRHRDRHTESFYEAVVEKKTGLHLASRTAEYV